jgi:hypothetical protein
VGKEHSDDLGAYALTDVGGDDAIVTGWTQTLTHVVFVARDYGSEARRLEAMSVCGRHAAQLEHDLAPAL